MASQYRVLLKSATFFGFLGLCGCLVLEGRVACLVHGLAGSEYTSQSGAAGRQWALIATLILSASDPSGPGSEVFTDNGLPATSGHELLLIVLRKTK